MSDSVQPCEEVEEEEEEEDDEEEEEPILKYSRFDGAISQILSDDSISAFAICATTIALGSHNGLLYLLDLKGAEIKRYRAHSAAVSSVSIDQNGATVVSASIDGRVVVYSIAKKETSMFDFKRPLRAVAIDPDYHQNGKGRIVSGGLAGNLILTERGWMGNKETTLSAGQGPILETAWHGHLLAWANDQGVRIYDMMNMRLVGSVDRRPGSPRADLFRCRLLWQDSATLIIGWFDHITKVVIQEGVGRVLNLDTTYIMKLDSVVSGMAMLGDNLLVMAYLADLRDIQSPSFSRGSAERPEIRIINSQFEEISEDALGLRGFARLQPNDYALFSHPKEKSFFVVSPKDIVSACERDRKDHIQWLLDMEKYGEALEASQNEIGLPFELSYGEIGRKFLAHLHEVGDYKRAAELAPKVFVEDVEAWEKTIFFYAEKGHLEDITPFVPTEHPVLSSVVYEMALGRYLSSNQAMLLSTVQKWPVDIYNVDDIANAIEHRLIRKKDEKLLQESLAELFIKTDRPRDALPYYLALGKPETFELIQQFHLFDAVQDDILQLVTLDVPTPSADVSPSALANSQAINMLVSRTHSVPMHKVVDQLRDRPALQYCYFRAMMDHDPHLGADFSDLQISLYAEYDREKLMELLKSTSSYSLENAAKICEQRNYIPELVFILGKTGNNKKALKLIIEKLGDVQQAITFAHSQADPELWEDLVRYSLDKPTFIRGLLENAGTAINPISLIRRIPTGLPIPGLKDTLTKIFNDYDLQMSLSQCGGTIHRGDISNLSNRLRTGQRRGLSVDPRRIEQQADCYVFFDGGVVSKTQLGLESTVTAPTNFRRSQRGHVQRGRRQQTAGKITDSAINKAKLLAHLNVS